MTTEQIIDRLGLEPLYPEGGFYLETYVSSLKIDTKSVISKNKGERSLLTAIYYLLTPDTKSKLHRLASDEIYHFYLGDPVQMLLLYPDGSSSVVFLGSDLACGQRPQLVVPAGVWQGSFLVEGGRYALMGTTVSPGFIFEDYEKPDIGYLYKKYPMHKDLIERLA